MKHEIEEDVRRRRRNPRRSGGRGRRARGRRQWHARGPAAPSRRPAAIASYLGLTPAQLRQQLGAGKTLAQIAVAQGKTVAGLEEGDLRRRPDPPRPGGRQRQADHGAGADAARPTEAPPRRPRQPRLPKTERPARPARPAPRRRGPRLPRHHAGAAPHRARGRARRSPRSPPATGKTPRRPEGGDPRARSRRDSTRRQSAGKRADLRHGEQPCSLGCRLHLDELPGTRTRR